MKKKLLIALSMILSGALPSLLAEELSAPANPQPQRPVPLEHKSPAPDDQASQGVKAAVGNTLQGAKELAATTVENLKDASWEQKAELKIGNIYYLRRSTDDPLKPGEIVILRFRSPSEKHNKDFLYARNTRAMVEHKAPEAVPNLKPDVKADQKSDPQSVPLVLSEAPPNKEQVGDTTRVLGSPMTQTDPPNGPNK